MRGGREVVGILVRRDEVKPAFKQQQQQLAAPARPTEQTSLPFTDRLRLLKVVKREFSTVSLNAHIKDNLGPTICSNN